MLSKLMVGAQTRTAIFSKPVAVVYQAAAVDILTETSRRVYSGAADALTEHGAPAIAQLGAARPTDLVPLRKGLADVRPAIASG
jgi:hypothetical protein